MNNVLQAMNSITGLPCESAPKSLEVSRFDRVVGFLLAAMFFMGLLTALLFLIWIWPRPVTQPKQIWPNTGGGGGALANEAAAEFEAPLAEEIEQLESSQPATMYADLQDAVTLVALEGRGLSGTGVKYREIGPDIENEDVPTDLVLPRYNRWKLVFTARNADEYARQLDGLRIELGVLGGGIEGVDYARDFTQSSRIRHGDSEQEKRLYFRWQQSDNFARFDAQLLRHAGIESGKRIVAMFLDPNLESEMAVKELDWATNAGVTNTAEIGQTVFEVRTHDNVYQFQVVEQRRRFLPK